MDELYHAQGLRAATLLADRPALLMRDRSGNPRYYDDGTGTLSWGFRNARECEKHLSERFGDREQRMEDAYKDFMKGVGKLTRPNGTRRA